MLPTASSPTATHLAVLVRARQIAFDVGSCRANCRSWCVEPQKSGLLMVVSCACQAIACRLLLGAARQATGISFAAPTRTRDESRKYRRATLERGDRLRATARRAPTAGRGRAHACAHTRASALHGGDAVGRLAGARARRGAGPPGRCAPIDNTPGDEAGDPRGTRAPRRRV